jgi:hypothetical protein
MTSTNDDAGMREVFRGDLSSVELAKGVLDGAGIDGEIRWEVGAGAQLSPIYTPLASGQIAVLLVPSMAYGEARESLTDFEMPHFDGPNDLAQELEQTENGRRFVAWGVLLGLAMALVFAIWTAILNHS